MIGAGTWSFRTRLTLRWTAAFGLLLAVTLGAVYVASRALAYHDLDRQARTLAATELASSTDTGTDIHLHDFPVDALGTTDFAGKFAQLYDAGGQVLAQSSVLPSPGILLPPDELRAALRGDAPVFDIDVGGRPGRMVALRASHRGRDYVIAVGLFADAVTAHLVRLAWLLTVVWLIGVSLTALLGSALASTALAPIDSITRRASAVARGQFATRLEPPRINDEIGRMTTLLNEMLERLHGALEANRRFAADASHELRGPLTAMAGEIDVALKRERTAADYRDTLEVVRARLSELGTLTEDLILLARAEEGSRETILKEVPLGALFQASRDRLAPLARSHRVRIEFESLAHLVAYGDAHLLARVADNLLANAVVYNRDDGRVVVRGVLDEAEPDAWTPATVVITVSDTGPGIPEALWDRVFERFFRVDPSRSRRSGGTGLGLALSRSIVTLFNGSVRVSTSGPEGTTFELRLPGRLAAQEGKPPIAAMPPVR